ncbi:PH domain-containing protein [Solicola gregarius]|uniref:PH domain-containing protein n=1 Tax=Solicola gregarius TaxID=2908642 RepID=A0AA46TH83_9ACTN|nr:PH domain-containing protein [Solicola gregarius]UYM05230.1 PH domain-containing protein [Solicola gregarius]
MTYRPIGARIIAYVAVGCFAVMFVVIAAALPDEVRASISPPQLVTLLSVFIGALAVLHGIGRTRVRTDNTGLHILNGYRRHDLVWAEVISIELGRDAPWAVIDTTDGEAVSVMAIQAADGTRARAAVRRLRAEIADHS